MALFALVLALFALRLALWAFLLALWPSLLGLLLPSLRPLFPLLPYTAPSWGLFFAPEWESNSEINFVLLQGK